MAHRPGFELASATPSRVQRGGLSLAVGLLAFAAARAASADPSRNNLDSAAALTAEGWMLYTDGGQPTFTSGTMQITTQSAMEWSNAATHIAAPGGMAPPWWLYVTSERGWWFEARVKVLDAPANANRGPGLWIHDGQKLQQLGLGKDAVTLSTREQHTVAFNTTDDFHVYRVQRPSADVLQLLIDGKKVLDFSTVGEDVDGSKALNFGGIGGVPSSSVWDYIAYDTAAPGTEKNDDDKDGIPLSRDLCPKVKDDGKDSDFDNIGDACDACPRDTYNDEDQDGLCADVDVCPHSASNVDVNQNGRCDTDECSTGLPAGYFTAQAGTANAEICAVNGLMCPCFRLPGAGGAGGQPSAAGGKGGAAGGSAGGAPGTAGAPGSGGGPSTGGAPGAGGSPASSASGGAGGAPIATAGTTGVASTGGATLRGGSGGAPSGSGGAGGGAMSGSSGGTSPTTSVATSGGGCAIAATERWSNQAGLGLSSLLAAALVRRARRRRR